MRRAALAGVVGALLMTACGSGVSPGGASNRPADPQPAATAGSTAGGTAEDRSEEPPVDRAAGAAPDFTVAPFEGGRFTLSEKTGMPVVINFFDSW